MLSIEKPEAAISRMAKLQSKWSAQYPAQITCPGKVSILSCKN